jgi:hypothetical protein
MLVDDQCVVAELVAQHDIPNTHFDPEKGHKLYKEYLDELVWPRNTPCST